MKIKIYGFGWVGKAEKVLFPEASVHDPEQGFIDKEDADVAFVCVPTPLKDGRLDVSIVEDLVKNTNDKLYIIRSTVMPGTCDYLTSQGKEVVMMPEYLGETVNHPMTDQKARPFIVIGGSPKNRRSTIELHQSCYNAAINIRQVSCLEAEVIKLSENRAIGFKMMQIQELYDVCEKAGVDFYTIREAVYSDDPRFNLWFSFVYPGKRGFNNSKCLKKDIPGWCAWAESVGIDPKLTQALVDKSNEYEKYQIN
jgi:UDP-glucose 6-dehydrogenase